MSGCASWRARRRQPCSVGRGPESSAGRRRRWRHLPAAGHAACKVRARSLEPPLVEIVVKLDGQVRSGRVGGGDRGALQQLHGGVDDYQIQVPQALLAQKQETQRIFSIVMGCIAGISARGRNRHHEHHAGIGL